MTDNTPPTTDTTQMGSGRMLAPQSQSLAPRAEAVPDYLKPASQDDFRRELTSCLALCAPAGFDGPMRREWLTTAWATLKDVPADLLMRGCRVARQYSDHPSKIVPAISREIEAPWAQRKQSHGFARGPAITAQTDKPTDIVTPEQAAVILSEFGLKRDPSQPLVEPPVSALGAKDFLQSASTPVELADNEIPWIEGLSVSEIFAQRDRIRAAKLMGEMASEPLSTDEYADFAQYFTA